MTWSCCPELTTAPVSDWQRSTANFHRNLNTRSAAPQRAAAAQLIDAAAVEIKEEVTQPLVSVRELLDT